MCKLDNTCCCICFNNDNCQLILLSSLGNDGVSLYYKLTAVAPEMCCKEIAYNKTICKVCQDDLQTAYRFKKICKKSKIVLTDCILRTCETNCNYEIIKEENVRKMFYYLRNDIKKEDYKWWDKNNIDDTKESGDIKKCFEEPKNLNGPKKNNLSETTKTSDILKTNISKNDETTEISDILKRSISEFDENAIKNFDLDNDSMDLKIELDENVKTSTPKTDDDESVSEIKNSLEPINNLYSFSKPIKKDINSNINPVYDTQESYPIVIIKSKNENNQKDEILNTEKIKRESEENITNVTESINNSTFTMSSNSEINEDKKKTLEEPIPDIDNTINTTNDCSSMDRSSTTQIAEDFSNASTITNSYCSTTQIAEDFSNCTISENCSSTTEIVDLTFIDKIIFSSDNIVNNEEATKIIEDFDLSCMNVVQMENTQNDMKRNGLYDYDVLREFLIPKEKINGTEYLSNNSETHLIGHTLTVSDQNESHKHSCRICSKSFLQEDHLILHVKTHTKTVKYTCHICDKEFSIKSHLNNHTIVTHLDPLSCDICKTKRLHKSEDIHINNNKLKTNSETIDDDKLNIYVIPNLKKKSIHERNYFEEEFSDFVKNQVMNHKRLNEYLCHVCGDIFNEYDFENHLDVHNRSYSCDICLRSFREKSALKKHKIFVHSDLKKFVCTRCDKKFKFKQSLNHHMSVHNENTFDCNICEKRFTNKSYLKVHKRIHYGIRPFVCKYCTKSFIQSTNLRTHMKNCADYINYLKLE